ncbi:MAG: peptidylprolyl isomerase [Clostridia bacterium]|nr:peptidylprolyl isomerase [Clostridia bacterium]
MNTLKTSFLRRAVCAVVSVLLIVTLAAGCDKESAIEGGLDSEATYYADIVIKDYGTITVELYQNMAPITVENFINLAESGFYDGLTFHRIMKGFMIQGGDPGGDGISDDNQETIVGEFESNGYDNPLSHKRGVISMARTGDPNSASSQFFIMHKDSPHLDGDYAAFGEVTEGIEVVDAVCESAQPVDGNGKILASQQPVIETITIRKK